jgi:dienelactone hydrolase
VTRTHANGDERTVTYTVWYPALPQDTPTPGSSPELNDPSAEGEFPLIVFSHGFGGGPHDSSFLHEHLASHGFIVAAPGHRDCQPECPRDETEFRLQTDYRLEDVESVLEDALALNSEGDEILGGRIDTERLGVAGFSCGGYTAIRASQIDERFLAVLALTPSCGLIPLDPQELNKRLMIIHGELDSELPIAFNVVYYANIPPEAPDRWFVSLHGAGHALLNTCVSFLTRAPRCEDLAPHVDTLLAVKRWATAFLLAFVAEDERYVPLTDPGVNEDRNVSVALTRMGEAPATLPTVVPAGVTPTPSAAAGTVLFEEDLQSLEGALAEYEGAGYENDGYIITTESRPESSPGQADRPRVAVPGAYGDVTIAVDAALIHPADDQYIDVACRSQGNASNYRFGIAPNLGEYNLIQTISDRSVSLIGGPNQTSPAIRRGNETNRLELTCRGTVIEASVNGVMVASVSTGAFNAGEVWFGAGQFVDPGTQPDTPLGSEFQVRFTNLVVRQE